MTQEEKELLLKDLSARLPYGVKVQHQHPDYLEEVQTVEHISRKYGEIETNSVLGFVDDFKPYLRPLSSMTDEEAKEIVTLYGLKDILSIKKITDEYIEVVVDDGFCGTETGAIWYNEIISSIEIFDWLNENMFDYRGLIPMGLALETPKDMYK